MILKGQRKKLPRQRGILKGHMIDNQINYIELRANDLDKIKEFYTASFGWAFTDYGSENIAFSKRGVSGGFEHTDDEIINGALIVLYHKNLKSIKDQIIKSKGKISKKYFFFSGRAEISLTHPATSWLFGLSSEQSK